jgi:hypothetical protein
MTVIPQAAEVVWRQLTAVGLGPEQIRWWFDQPRRELSDLSPAVILDLAAEFTGAAQTVLELARADAEAIRVDRDAAHQEREHA